MTVSGMAYGMIGLLVGLVVSVASRWLPLRRLQQTPLSQGEPRASLRRLAQDMGAQDAWVVIAMGTLFGALWSRYGPSLQLAVASMYTAIFLLILVIDVTHRWVPNVLLVSATLLALAASLFTNQPPLPSALLGGVVGFAWFYLIAAAYPKGLGAGDVKLAGLVGLITGFPDVVTALTLGILIGGIAAGLLLITGRVDRKSYIPYAPFLVTGAWVDLVFGAEILSRYQTLWAK